MAYYLVKHREIYENKVLVEAESEEEAYEKAADGEGVFSESNAQLKFKESIFAPYNPDLVEEIHPEVARQVKELYTRG